MINQVILNYKRSQNTRSNRNIPPNTDEKNVITVGDNELDDFVVQVDNQVDDGNEKTYNEQSLDQVVDNISDELINQLQIMIPQQNTKAIWFKAVDNVLYLSSHMIALTILILSLYQGASSSEDKDSVGNQDSTYFFVISVLAGIDSLLVELNKRYEFKARSVTIYECGAELDDLITILRELKVDSRPPEQKMIIIKKIESKINDIQMKSFDRDLIKTKPPDTIVVGSS